MPIKRRTLKKLNAKQHKKNSPKRRCEKLHAKKRFWQRFREDLSNKELTEICAKLQNQQYKFIERQSYRITIWQGIVKEKEVYMVYDSKRNVIVSFMPLNYKVFGNN